MYDECSKPACDYRSGCPCPRCEAITLADDVLWAEAVAQLNIELRPKHELLRG